MISAADMLAAVDRGEPCEFCDDTFRVDVLEFWPDDRAFMLDACCESVYELATDAMREWSRRDWQTFMGDTIDVDVRTVITGATVSGSWTVDFGLEVRPIDFASARDFVGRHHRHNKPPRGWRFGLGCWNGAELVAVVMVGRPVARMIDSRTTVEVNRLCVDPTLDPGLVWNACSMLYAAAARESAARGFGKVITYTLETEDATSVKAAGWTPEAKTRGGSWNRPSRDRADTAPTCRKVRWARILKPARAPKVGG